MILPVEVLGRNDFGDFVKTAVIQHQTAENSLFCFHRMRGNLDPAGFRIGDAGSQSGIGHEIRLQLHDWEYGNKA